MGTNSTNKLADIVERFLIEPRGDWATGRRWLVVLDQCTGKYIQAFDEGKGSRSYKRFEDSREVIQWLLKNYDAINALAK